MAGIRPRKRADGTISYTAQIRIQKDGAQVYTESQTFVHKKVAEAWVKRRETEVSESGAIERAKKGGVLLRDVIDKYLAEVGQARPLGRTKECTLRAIAASHLGDMALFGPIACDCIYGRNR